MAIVTTPVSTRGGLLLNKGQNPNTGKVITGQGNIPGLKSGADNSKLYNVAAAYAECTQYPVIRIYKTETVELENE